MKLKFAVALSCAALCGCGQKEEVVVAPSPVIVKKLVPVAGPTPTPVVIVQPGKVLIVPRKKTTIIRETKVIKEITATPAPTKAPTPIPTPKPTPKPRATAKPKPAATPRPVLRPTPRPTAAPTKSALNAGTIIVRATVEKTSKVPDPNSVAYSQSLVFLKYRVQSVERGQLKERDILAVHWGMKNKKLLPAARYRVGESHRLQLEPFDAHPELDRLMRNDDTEEFELPTYYVVRAD